MLLMNFCFSESSINLLDLVNELGPISSQWRQLGIQFRFTENDLDGIKQNSPHGGVDEWMSTMLDKKLKSTPGFGWDDIVEALRNIGCGALAEHIQQSHCPQGWLYIATCTCTFCLSVIHHVPCNPLLCGHYCCVMKMAL